MSVITQRGDQGQTDLMYGRRVAKNNPRIVANGAIDELNAVLGIVRWHARNDACPDLDSGLADVQAKLISLMGEVATDSRDQARYEKDGYSRIATEDVNVLTTKAKELEAQLERQSKTWAIPGESGPLASAQLDHARTLCRRAEGQVTMIPEFEKCLPTPLTFLNRLSDYLWILARALDHGVISSAES